LYYQWLQELHDEKMNVNNEKMNVNNEKMNVNNEKQFDTFVVGW